MSRRRHHRHHNRPAHVAAPMVSGHVMTEEGSDKILPGDQKLDPDLGFVDKEYRL